MASAEIPTKYVYQMRLNNGQTSSGSMKLANVSLGKLSLARFSLDNAYTLSGLLTPCLDLALHANQLTETTQVART